MLAVAMLTTGTGVLLVWAGVAGENPVVALTNLIREGRLTSGKAWKIEPVSTPALSGGVSITGAGGSAGKVSRSSVAAYGSLLTQAFGPRVIHHCRANSSRPPGGAANSLHYVRNGCRALDMRSTPAEERALARWAIATGQFAEVIYTRELSQGSISDSTLAYHDGRKGVRHVHLGFKSGNLPPTPPRLASRGAGGIS